MKGESDCVEKINRYKETDKIAITVITEYELLKTGNKQILDQSKKFIDSVEVYHTNEDTAKTAAETYKNLKNEGKMINENDIIIAGMCISIRETLITRDRDFENIKGLKTVFIASQSAPATNPKK